VSNNFLFWLFFVALASPPPFQNPKGIRAKQKSMGSGARRGRTQNSRSGGTRPHGVFWSGCWAVTEFVSERTIIFHTTTRFARATLDFITNFC